MRTGANAEVVAIAPIDQIVPRLGTGLGIVGDFVAKETGSLAELVGASYISAARSSIRKPCETAFFVSSPKSRAFLDS